MDNKMHDKCKNNLAKKEKQHLINYSDNTISQINYSFKSIQNETQEQQKQYTHITERPDLNLRAKVTGLICPLCGP